MRDSDCGGVVRAKPASSLEAGEESSMSSNVTSQGSGGCGGSNGSGVYPQAEADIWERMNNSSCKQSDDVVTLPSRG